MQHNTIMRKNFIIMSLIWIATSSTYYIFSFYITKIPDNILVLNAASSIPEMLSVSLSWYLYSKVGLKKALLLSFAVCCIGSIFLLSFQYTNYNQALEYFVFCLKFGVGSSFSLIYLSNFIFPVTLAG